jgi:hypothetical protein
MDISINARRAEKKDNLHQPEQLSALFCTLSLLRKQNTQHAYKQMEDILSSMDS